MKNQRGFTVAELLIVVAIVGILGAMIATAVGKYTGHSSTSHSDQEQ
jgi:prepilin-type N-terminal cleavage/methylation domain-containing protein